jgi:hypothetical protein
MFLLKCIILPISSKFWRIKYENYIQNASFPKDLLRTIQKNFRDKDEIMKEDEFYK